MSDPTHENPDETPEQQFESIRHINPYGEEYWSARELAPLLGYDAWRRFAETIDRAMAACRNAGQEVADHFVASGKMIGLGKGAQREIVDYFLSRFGCYLVAMNGDPRKPEIAAAQAYFAVQTRRMEVLQEQAGELTDLEQRLLIRQRVISSNKKLSEAAAGAGVNRQSFGIFHDAGYRGLYGGMGAQAIKEYKGIGKRFVSPAMLTLTRERSHNAIIRRVSAVREAWRVQGHTHERRTGSG